MKKFLFTRVQETECLVNFVEDCTKSIPESLLIVDSGVPKFKGKTFSHTYTLKGGEHIKSIDRVLEIYQLFKVSKKDSVTAVGGGALLDLVGYSAFTYTGLKHLSLVPSTPLSQVMLPVSGSFFVNLEFRKDVLRASGIPKEVIIEPKLSYEVFDHQGVYELFPIIITAYSYDWRLFNYVSNLISEGMEIDLKLWEDLLWSSLKAYIDGISNDCEPVGISMARILQSAFRLKLDYMAALAFGAVIESWVGLLHGLLEEERTRKFFITLKKIWSNNWPYRLDMSSVNEYIDKLKEIVIWLPGGAQQRRIVVNSAELFRMIRKNIRGLESFM